MKAIRILVLESNDKSISQIIEILKNNNFLVDICSNNDEFLESIYYNLYDLYLLNINEERRTRHIIRQLKVTKKGV